MCVTALANLHWKRVAATGENRSSQQFTLNDDIVPYFTENWENLTSMPRRVKSTWHQTLQKTLIKETELFRHRLEDGEYQFSLADTDLTLIGPNNDAVKQVGRKAIAGVGGAEKGDADAIEGPKTRGASKRSKANESTNQSGKRQKKFVLFRDDMLLINIHFSTTDYTSMKLSGFAYPIDHPFNRDGYRYFLAEQDNHAPNRCAHDSNLFTTMNL
jgi:Set1/Ash2 histone methyltransferase complex subunit ASH2